MSGRNNQLGLNLAIVANKAVNVASMANELYELVVAKGCNELDELIVAKGHNMAKGQTKSYVVAKGHDELDKLVVVKDRVIWWVFRIFVFDGRNNQLEHSRRLVIIR
jgi:hypothetical protein